MHYQMVGTQFLEISSILKKSSCHLLNIDLILNLTTFTEYQRKLMRLSYFLPIKNPHRNDSSVLKKKRR